MPRGLIDDMIACWQIMHGAERKPCPRKAAAMAAAGSEDMDEILFRTLK